MNTYPKIQSIFKRDEQTHKFILNQFSCPEFEYLQHNNWVFTEKIDGTNIRVGWLSEIESIKFGGRTENAQIPTFLYDKLQSIFSVEKFNSVYTETSMTLYGEGYGGKIQKGGGNYIPGGVDFILFDVLVDDWWLRREDVEDVAIKLGLRVVPIIGEGRLVSALELMQPGESMKSTFGDFLAEGLVLKPKIELRDRNGRRIMTKVKHKDF